ncbi:TonB-dependent receptor plug domain-containing protein [Romeria aff. gracilis LEGE 07310]|uniref:TonB-dependent receptor plug domain-containing protein n=1 Tax=Vasconcelosia minhoensis LEGE 07310 TaxID=915328 RepID=A0A8J7DDI3_9CYAN|nr:TonB-dependent receptor plug domain-containing protein [Romeria gracilis]MBE9079912.1 TonB-dependent receptor plug domain-containing protein [Romeria aff. gracilis LEGE 07310]
MAVTGTDAPPTAQISSEAGNLILSVVPGVAQAGAADEAIQIAVTGEQDEGYDPSTATTGTRIEAPLEDLPLSIQVIPREVIEDRQVVRLQELADNVPGVEPYSGYGGLSSNDY